MTKRVLIVEDEQIQAAVLEMMLSERGITVVGNVSTANLALMAAEQEHPDLVLMDVALHDRRDGIDAARLIHERFGTPIVFVTGYSIDSRLVSAMEEVDAIGYLKKPYDEEDLVRYLTDAMQ